MLPRISPQRATLLTVSALALLAACGGKTDADEVAEIDRDSQPNVVDNIGLPPSGQSPEQQQRSISAQSSASCVALPPMPAQEPALSYEQSCAVSEFVPAAADMSHGEDARPLLVGRWELCGAEALYGSQLHDGIEFGSNGRDQLLRRQNGALVPVADGPTGEYTLLASGQFMQSGELSLNEYAVFMEFDASQSALRFASAQGELRYARVAPDLQSAAANRFSTRGGGCSMVGVWDTMPDGVNPPAAFAFNEQGEWFGGAWGSDLCSAHSMFGTYQLIDRPVGGGDDTYPTVSTEFELVTNVGAGRCAFWFNAGFSPRFSEDCKSVELTTTWDNCTGARGYLARPEPLIRRTP